MTRSGSWLRCWRGSRRRTSLTGRPWRTWSTSVTATLEMRGRGLLICPAQSQVITPARSPLSTRPGPVLLPRPVPPPVHLVLAVLPVLLLPVLLLPVLLLPVLLLPVLAV